MRLFGARAGVRSEATDSNDQAHLHDLERKHWLPQFFEVGLHEIASLDEKVPGIDDRETTQRRNFGHAFRHSKSVGSARQDKQARYSHQNNW